MKDQVALRSRSKPYFRKVVIILLCSTNAVALAREQDVHWRSKRGITLVETSSNGSNFEDAELKENYIPEARGLSGKMVDDSSKRVTHQALINNHGSVLDFSNRESRAVSMQHEVHAHAQPMGPEEIALREQADPMLVVRREAPSSPVEVDTSLRSAHSGGAALDDAPNAQSLLQEASGNVKIILLTAVVVVALVLVCVAAVYLVWQPLNAIMEERAFEKAAQNALLAAVPPAAPTNAEGGTTEEANTGFREEQLKKAWKTFFDDPVLNVKGENLMRRVMEAFFEKEGFTNQMEDLFKGLAAEGEDTIKKDDMERVCESVSGNLHNMHVKGSGISTVDFKRGFESSLAVVAVEDYGWLFDSYDTVFPEDKPLDRKCFPGLISLVLAWNCVRTLHTARHMRSEEVHRTTSSSDLSSTVSVELKIDLRGGVFPFEGKAEIDVGDRTSDDGAEDGGDEPKKKDSWSDKEEEVAP